MQHTHIFEHNEEWAMCARQCVLHTAINLSDIYSGADKSLAWPGRKQATFPAFYGTWSFIITFTTVHHLSLP